MKTICFTNVFNEEYLLPFWLYHHRNMFDEIVVVDYNSTDGSMDICRKMVPNCRILTTRNDSFAAIDIDQEFMDLESDEEDAIKIVLNTTEFLFSERPIRDIFADYGGQPVCLSIRCLSPYSERCETVYNYHDLMRCVIRDDVRWHADRLVRFMHTFPNGRYNPGRHATNLHSTPCSGMTVVWFGFFPMSENLLKRKLQIQENIPQRDRQQGFGYHHLTTREKLLDINKEKYASGVKIDEYFIRSITNKYTNKTFVVVGGCGFIGSHLVDRLVELNYTVVVLDNMLSGSNIHPDVVYENVDICDYEAVVGVMAKYDQIDGIFHLAAIARTPWCIDDPLLCYRTNVMGTIHVLEAARQRNIGRVVLSSSNVVYAFQTPYRSSKEMLENAGDTYHKMYGLSVVSLRYSNVYGPRQSENGPSPNVFAALRKSKKESGRLVITGDGTQTRNFTHVKDIVAGNIMAMFDSYCGVIDLCTGVPVSLNEAARYFECPIEYTDERPGDIKHIDQSPDEAFTVLGWRSTISLSEGIRDVL